MIPWNKFILDETPLLTELVYQPTPYTLSRLEYYPHGSVYSNTPLLDTADERRFFISQLPPDERQQYLDAFHEHHVCRSRYAVQVLEKYIDRHAIIPLSNYDRVGRPKHYRENFEGSGVDRKVPDDPYQRMRRLSGRDEHDSRPDRRRIGQCALQADASSDISSSDSDSQMSKLFDLSESLPDLDLNGVNTVFGDLDALERFQSTDSELILSPELPVHPSLPEPSILDELTGLSSQDTSPSPDKPTPPPPPLTTAATTTSSSSSLTPLLTTTTAINTTSNACSIANLIHPSIAISTTSLTDSEEPDIDQLLSSIRTAGGRQLVYEGFDGVRRSLHQPNHLQQHQRTMKVARMRRGGVEARGRVGGEGGGGGGGGRKGRRSRSPSKDQRQDSSGAAMPTTAIEYEPLDLLPTPTSTATRAKLQTTNLNLKRKDRDDDADIEDEARGRARMNPHHHTIR